LFEDGAESIDDAVLDFEPALQFAEAHGIIILAG
jgi:hypothetical protein